MEKILLTRLIKILSPRGNYWGNYYWFPIGYIVSLLTLPFRAKLEEIYRYNSGLVCHCGKPERWKYCRICLILLGVK